MYSDIMNNIDEDNWSRYAIEGFATFLGGNRFILFIGVFRERLTRA